jgi:anti-sigma factor RsiW
MTPSCQSGVGLLMEYLEGTLAPDVSASLERHVAGCEKCAAFVESYRRTPAILRSATQAPLPPDLAASLQSWLKEERSKSSGG